MPGWPVVAILGLFGFILSGIVAGVKYTEMRRHDAQHGCMYPRQVSDQVLQGVTKKADNAFNQMLCGAIVMIISVIVMLVGILFP